MAKGYELPDAAWDLVAGIFYESCPSRRPRTDDRLMLNGCSVLAPPDAICMSALAHGRRFLSAFVTGAIAQRLTRCSSGFTSSSTSTG